MFSPLASAALACALLPPPVSEFDVLWTSPSGDESGSMPIGNGDLAANVWMEPDGGLRMYLSKSDAWDDNARLLKLGRLRLTLDPDPGATPFAQRLDLAAGAIRIERGGADGAPAATVSIRVDATAPVLVIDVETSAPTSLAVSLDHWRLAPRTIRDVTWSDVYCVDWGKPPAHPMVTEPDTVLGAAQGARGGEVVWFHRNERSPIPATFELQGIAELLPTYDDPILHRTFGCLVTGEGLAPQAPHGLRSAIPSTRHRVEVWALTKPKATAEQFLGELRALARAEPPPIDEHLAWWRDFWDRSWVRVSLAESVDDPRSGEAIAILNRGYLLQRYLFACAGRGGAPIKFNGSLFTVGRPGHDEGDPDYRRWGPGYWFQNTRLLYWPLFASGDLDLTNPFFALYRDALPLLAAAHGHRFGERLPAGAAAFHETIALWGLPDNASFGWNREGAPVGEVMNPYIRHYRSGSIELLVMAMERLRHAPDRRFLEETLLPLADAILTFYAAYYPREEDGTVRFEPAASLETWHDATDPLPEIAGLRYLLPRLLALDAEITEPWRRSRWAALLASLPEVPLEDSPDGRVIAPAARYGQLANVENPPLYAVWPYRIYGVGKPDLDLAVRTFAQRKNRANAGWCQDSIHAAHLGLAQEAAAMVLARAARSDQSSRFPAFWGPNYDWVPDQTHGANILNTLQSMLLQTDGDRIILLPAWPATWECSFRLHAPGPTRLTGEVRGGEVVWLEVDPPERRADVEVRPIGVSRAR